MTTRKTAAPHEVEAYSKVVTLDDGTWARMWLPSPADNRAFRELDQADMKVSVRVILDHVVAACVECHGPKPDRPADEQPTPWLIQLVQGWLSVKDGGLPPAPAAS